MNFNGIIDTIKPDTVWTYTYGLVIPIIYDLIRIVLSLILKCRFDTHIIQK
jgi:hypothetical protein